MERGVGRVCEGERFVELSGSRELMLGICCAIEGKPGDIIISFWRPDWIWMYLLYAFALA